jgi:hypothetical protein
MGIEYLPEVERDEAGRAVRLYFTPRELPADNLARESGRCLRPSCDQPVLPQRTRRGKPKVYCSERCGSAHWDEQHPRLPAPVQAALDFAPQPIPPVVDQRVPRRDVARLAGHNATVLDRLRAGSASGADLERLLGPGSAWRTRVSDVRQWLRRQGETVACRRDEAGVYVYTLERA